MKNKKKMQKWGLSVLVLPAILSAMLMMVVGCEDPAFDEPMEPMDQPMEEPVLPEE